MSGILDVPSHRRAALAAVLDILLKSDRVALTTHVNADGDGTGSEVAVAMWLTQLGKTVRIVNPTPYPSLYMHLLPETGWIRDPADARAHADVARADLVLVLDTSEPKRIGRISGWLTDKTVVVIDHHVPPDDGISGVVMEDSTACATGELIYDLLTLAGLPKPWDAVIIEAIYTAIVTDTGSFRFSNSTNRAHAIAGDLIEQGVDPEAVYRRLYATVPLRRIQLLRAALEHLEVDPTYPIAWITVTRETMVEYSATPDDLEGLIEHARSIEGTEVAVLFRETSDGSTKVSLRSAADVDVNAVARKFGGGGHVKAAGALIPEPMPHVVSAVLDAVRASLSQAGRHFRAAETAG